MVRRAAARADQERHRSSDIATCKLAGGVGYTRVGVLRMAKITASGEQTAGGPDHRGDASGVEAVEVDVEWGAILRNRGVERLRVAVEEGLALARCLAWKQSNRTKAGCN